MIFEDNIRRFAISVVLGLRRLGGRRAPGARVVATSLPAARSLDEQWSKLESVVVASIEKAHGTAQKHAVAALHLDAAHYTLGRIAEELVVAMPPIELERPVVVSTAFPLVGPKPALLEQLAA